MKKFRKVISKMYPEATRNCNGCNWRVSEHFAFEGQDIDKIGLCGECFAEVLRDGDYLISERIK